VSSLNLNILHGRDLRDHPTHGSSITEVFKIEKCGTISVGWQCAVRKLCQFLEKWTSMVGSLLSAIM
jgi:hypothetical protein